MPFGLLYKKNSYPFLSCHDFELVTYKRKLRSYVFLSTFPEHIQADYATVVS